MLCRPTLIEDCSVTATPLAGWLLEHIQVRRGFHISGAVLAPQTGGRVLDSLCMVDGVRK